MIAWYHGEMASELATRLGTRFEARAIHVGNRIDVRGMEPRLSPQLPMITEAGPGYAVLLRAGAVVLFGIDAAAEEKFLAEIESRIQEPYKKYESERAVIRVADFDGIELDALTLRELTVERLQVIAVILGRSVVLGRYELEVADAFTAIEPMAIQMKQTPRRLPWRQLDLVHQIGQTILAEHALVGRAEVLEKPDLLWDRSDLDRFYARLEDEYELRERYLALDKKLAVVTSAAQQMLELSQTRRSHNLEMYIIALFLLEIVLAVYQLVRG